MAWQTTHTLFSLSCLLFRFGWPALIIISQSCARLPPCSQEQTTKVLMKTHTGFPEWKSCDLFWFLYGKRSLYQNSASEKEAGRAEQWPRDPETRFLVADPAESRRRGVPLSHVLRLQSKALITLSSCAPRGGPGACPHPEGFSSSREVCQ